MKPGLEWLFQDIIIVTGMLGNEACPVILSHYDMFNTPTELFPAQSKKVLIFHFVAFVGSCEAYCGMGTKQK